MLSIPKVLLFGCDTSERDSLEAILAPHAELTWADTREQLARELEEAEHDIVFCSGSVSIMIWSELVEQVHGLAPSLPVILISEFAGDKEGLDLLADGGFDLLTSLCCGPELLPAASFNEVDHRDPQWHARAKAGDWGNAESWPSGVSIDTDFLSDRSRYEQKKSLPSL